MFNETILSLVSYDKLIPLIIPFVSYSAGIVLYAIFVFKFYKYLGKKDLFSLNLKQYNRASFKAVKKFITFLFYVIEYVLLFPLISFFWFVAISIMLIVLSKNQSVEQIVLLSATLVTAIRITAYYNEDLSKDLSKMLPFALLGVFMVNTSYFSIDSVIEKIFKFPQQLSTLFYFLIFLIVAEFIARLSSAMGPKKKIPESENTLKEVK